jgi:phosphatidylinositol glycan class N
MVNILSGVVLLIFWALFAVQKSPLMFYVYIVFPCYFWQQFLVQIFPVVAFKVQNNRVEGHQSRILYNGEMTILALLGMVVCTPFFVSFLCPFY